jgi:hypothetical protein
VNGVEVRLESSVRLFGGGSEPLGYTVSGSWWLYISKAREVCHVWEVRWHIGLTSETQQDYSPFHL